MANVSKQEEEELKSLMKGRKRDGEVRYANKTDDLQPIDAKSSEVTEIIEDAKEIVSIQEPKAAVVEDKPTSSKRSKSSKRNYDELFLQKRGIKVRHCAYIDKEVYRKAARYVKFISEDDITVGEYLDSIILNHFEEYDEEIKRRMRKAINM